MTAFLLTSSLTMVLAVRAAVFGNRKAQLGWLLATMACGAGFIILHGREWSHLISEGLTLPMFPSVPGHEANPEFANVTKTVPQFAATFFGLTGMHMLHVTLGVVYLGIIALRKKFIPILLALWLAAWLLTPAYSPFHYGAHVLLPYVPTILGFVQLVGEKRHVTDVGESVLRAVSDLILYVLLLSSMF